MAESAKVTFRDDNNGEQVIEKKNLVTVIPDTDGKSSLIIHVQHNADDGTSPPEVKFSKGAIQEYSRPDTAHVDETHIIISTGSGATLAKQFFDQAVSPVLQALSPASYPEFHIHHTKSATSILELTNEVFFPKANSGLSLRIILLSGDGGMIDLVNGLRSKPSSPSFKPPKVDLLPLGTANALYHSINAGKDDTWGLSSLATEHYHPLPIFTAAFSADARLLVDEARSTEELPRDAETGQPTLHGAVVCSWGMHASLVADSDTTEYRKFGIDRFKMAAKEALYPADGSPPHAYNARVSILRGNDWKQLYAREHMYVLASMVSNLEKTFTISPASKPLDGSMHLVHFGPTDGDEAMRIMGLAYQGGKHVDDKAVLYESIDGLKIQFEGREKDARWRRICVDGKIVRLDEDGWVEVRRKQRSVLDVAST
jgi:diacylglycerol kinase family enzyme